MHQFVILITLIGLLGPSIASAQESTVIGLYDLGACYQPAETYPFKLDNSDPLYETARADHQRFLEEMEGYVNCLDKERLAALNAFRASYDLFVTNFGADAVFRYGPSED
ncbi:hypothetical protein [Ahrensia marina]|jgi:hypothetical protein|uniref:Uncharacterized protein n=1 Tax=Ahrensia marina TaxID=1514904 RepID=A0A0N0E713_9HYPH|nr:hypothetical protein [Ahrensia marina]KPB00655.1 hypothetical protein SU32_12625 [Ahrensia marina]